LQLLAVTVVTHALRRADAIRLAAEACGFSSERSRALPIQSRSLDGAIILVAAVCLPLFAVLL
jgi:energy-coupling factor transporter transmembrane protein EcfT